MKLLHLIILNSLFLSPSLYGQPKVSLNETDEAIELGKGQKVLFYINSSIDNSTPDGGIIIADSVSYIISSNSLQQARYHRVKIRELDSLLTLTKSLSENLLKQNADMKRQIESEQNAVGGLIKVSEDKTQISKDAIKAITRKKWIFRAQGLAPGLFVGALVGALLFR